MLPICMTIAGSDSGGGAGIQADLKTFASLNCYGVSAITSVTAQNTLGVNDIHVIPNSVLKNQIDSINNDIGFNSVKTGMLPEESSVISVANSLKKNSNLRLVIDPVIVATSGDVLISSKAIEALKKKLFPLASIITPNLSEAEELTKMKITDKDDVYEACKILKEYGPKSVVIKGGHFFNSDVSEDVFYDGKNFQSFSVKRIDTTSTHGTGCTFSAAITAFLAKGEKLENSVNNAKTYVTNAINKAYKIGNGNGPLNHFFI
ncbi:MAG: bifunctional hydroxymethylpyrimidine kinase/phosphomethylpyrimidine kinase [SAR202 cluster bacterium]|nr:bifunctional hydroxymethylpyrimidine kinase/phosphomethylpyrimidine kinase [SAR202 cluster bacterium]